MPKAIELKKTRARRRRMHVRKKVFGTPERPRLAVRRSLKHIYAQIVDDIAGRTLASASTLAPDVRRTVAKGSNRAAAEAVGACIAERALAKGIRKVCFDRGPFRYHGRLKALADAARKGGLEF